MAHYARQAILRTLIDKKMNANLGLILGKGTIQSLLLPSAAAIRMWGDEEVGTDQQTYNSPLIENIEFQLYPITQFIREQLPNQVNAMELEFASMSGKALDEYEEWVWDNDPDFVESHPFETGLIELIRQADVVALMFAAEGERVGEFVKVPAVVVVNLLRSNVKNLQESNGFLATIVKDQGQEGQSQIPS